MKDNLLFDLDGTIIDPAEGITGAATYAIKKMGMPPLSPLTLEQFIGPPLDESFPEFCGFDDSQTQNAILFFREYFSEYGINQHTLYPQFSLLLKQLQNKGHRLYLATSKPTVFAEKILQDYHLTNYFSGIQGSNLDGPGTPKGEVIHQVLQDNNLTPSACLMIGDRKHDILGAKQNNMLSVGVLHGYGNEHELKNAGANYIVQDTKALAQLLNISL